MKKVRESSVFICSIVKNAGKGLLKNLPVVEELIFAFKNANVFIYENDSDDNTKSILNAWSNRLAGKVKISLNDNIEFPTPSPIKEGSNKYFCRRRIEKMVWLRNKYLDYIDDSGWNGDYLIVVDLDVAQLTAKPILDAFEANADWDALSAYGYSMSPKLHERYHDTYAYSPYGKEYDKPQTEKDIYCCQKDFRHFKKTGELMPVSSAFGGLSIYRWDAVKGLRYQLEVNNDNRVECYCEHRSLYRQMYQRGFENFFIDPKLRLKYQNVDLKLIRKWLCSKLKPRS